MLLVMPSYLMLIMLCLHEVLAKEYLVDNASGHVSVNEIFFKRLQLHEKRHRYNLVLNHIKNAGKRNAVCMDGSHAKYYMSRNHRSRDWLIHLQGGGSCISQQDCSLRAKSPLGSSLPLDHKITGDWLLSNDKKVNPTFHEWNKVFIPYCSGDVFVGRMTHRNHPYRLSMTGHYITTSIIEDLISNHKINDRNTKILFGGTSAGGIGVLANLDHVANLVHPAKIHGYNDGGWFTMYPTYGEYKNSTRFDIPKFFYMISELFNEKWNGFVDKSCAESTSAPAACLYGEIAIQHITTPIYVMSHIWDTYQLTRLMHNRNDGILLPPTNDGEIEFLIKFANHSLDSMTRIRDKSTNGAFGTACYSHTFLSSCIGNSVCDIPKTKYKINGKSAFVALSEWYESGGRKGSYIDDIGTFPSCNPTCCSMKCRKCSLKTSFKNVTINDEEFLSNHVDGSQNNNKKMHWEIKKTGRSKKRLAYMYCSESSDVQTISYKLYLVVLMAYFTLK